MIWIGIATATCYTIFALTVLYLLIERWNTYRLLTRTFFLVYSVFLGCRAYTMLYEPVTSFTVARAILILATLIPLSMVTVRIMRLGDPFQLSKIVHQLKKQLREKKKLEEYRDANHLSSREHIRVQFRLDEIDSKIEQFDGTLQKVLSLTRKNKLEAYGKLTFRVIISQIIRHLGL